MSKPKKLTTMNFPGDGGMDITWNYTILKGFCISSSSEHNEKTKRQNETKTKNSLTTTVQKGSQKV